MLSNPLAIAGFGPLGPVAGEFVCEPAKHGLINSAGSAAAIWQASIGNVVAGSLFATLQSWGMTGGFLIPGIGWIMAGLSVGAFLLAQMA